MDETGRTEVVGGGWPWPSVPRWRAAGLTGVFTVTAGRFHTAAMSPEGAGWVWGRNSLGQVGDGTTADRPRPVNVMVQEEA
ncbi:hypothetical protein [Myxococcus sp. NMCA1]|uniref:hypothetical protein n=1 Tax=Myxococcus sp. NMCA1 TaxID=2996785 RepID=UPI003FA5578D